MIRALPLAVAAASLLACAPDSPSETRERLEGYVSVADGVRLYYVEKGSGPEVLVAPMAVYLEPHLLDELSKSRRVIFYDPRNRGRSDAAPLSEVSLDIQIADLEALREALGLEQMALLGWSGLGMEMAVYALRHPDRVTRLVQMSAVPPAASIMREAGDARNDMADRAAIEAIDRRADAGEFDDDPAAYCRLRNELTNPANFADKAFVDEVPDVCDFENEWPKNLWPYFGAYLPSSGDYDWREELMSLDTPRLVIHGREDGIPLAGGEAWATGYPNARFLVLSPAGHCPYIEQNAAVVSAIETFLGGDWPEDAVQVSAPE